VSAASIFFRDLRASLKAGTKPAPYLLVCTREAPDSSAKYHDGVVEVGTVVRDGDRTRYRCADCGAEWER